jgi:hypothetical protein
VGLRRSRAWLTGIGLWLACGAVGLASDLPIHSEHLEAARESPFVGVRNQLDLEQLWGCIGAGNDYLSVNLAGVTSLLDGSEVDPTRIYGRTFVGPYPFEAKETSYAYKRFRAPSEIRGGQGTIRVGSLLGPGRDSEDWTDRGQVVLRLELFLEGPGPDRPLGTYDMFVFWRKGPDGFVKLPSLVEGPFVSLTRSDEPEACVISFRTDEPIVGAVLLEDGREFAEAGPALKHEIAVGGLEPDSTYRYRVRVGSMTTQAHELKTAPLPGRGETTLVYIGDSREGVGGGSPEGYILPDQLEWLKRELKSADRDETVRFVVLFAQEPLFPNGGHVRDTMWYHGNNNVRAWSLDAQSGKLEPMPKGMLEVRDELVRAVAASPKVAAVLGGDEHNSHRTLIGPEVPIGDIRKDDQNGNGRIEQQAGEPISPLGDLGRSTWYIVSGGGGAPYYGEEETPWNRYWKSRREEEGDDGYYFSSSGEHRGSSDPRRAHLPAGAEPLWRAGGRDRRSHERQVAASG